MYKQTKEGHFWKHVGPTSWNQTSLCVHPTQIIPVVTLWEHCRALAREWCSVSSIYLTIQRSGNMMQQSSYILKDRKWWSEWGCMGAVKFLAKLLAAVPNHRQTHTKKPPWYPRPKWVSGCSLRTQRDTTERSEREHTLNWGTENMIHNFYWEEAGSRI